MLPRTTAAFSSVVPVARLFELNLGSSVLSSSQMKWPLSVKIRLPVGFAPSVGVRWPSGFIVSDDSKVHAPASCSVDCAYAGTEPPESVHRPINAAAAIQPCVRLFMNLLLRRRFAEA